jgi:hypothetical protein
LPGNQRVQLSLKGKDKQRSALLLTLRDRQSILPSRASPPFGVASATLGFIRSGTQTWLICVHGRYSFGNVEVTGVRARTARAPAYANDFRGRRASYLPDAISQDVR